MPIKLMVLSSVVASLILFLGGTEALAIAAKHREIFGSPDEFINNFRAGVQGKLDEYMGALVAVFLFTLGVKAYLK